MPLVPQDEQFHTLVSEVRAVRAVTTICPSAKAGVNVPELLNTIIKEEVYKEDYNTLTVKLLEDRISYEDAILALKTIAESAMFDE